MMRKRFKTEFIIETRQVTEESVVAVLTDLGEGLAAEDIGNGERDCVLIKVSIMTHVPELVLDAIAQYGRLMHIKVEEAHPPSERIQKEGAWREHS
jgi:dihydroxyacetone kinase-like predicted kinase